MSDILESKDQEAENMVRAARTTNHREAVRAFTSANRNSAVKSAVKARRFANAAFEGRFGYA
jgi:hypothetical protein